MDPPPAAAQVAEWLVMPAFMPNELKDPPSFRQAFAEPEVVYRGAVTAAPLHRGDDLDWIDELELNPPESPARAGQPIAAGDEHLHSESPRHWESLAGPYAHQLGLNAAEMDVLGLLDRVVVRCKGWGVFDRSKGRKLGILLVPRKLAAQSSRRAKKSDAKAVPVNSYRKAMPRLQRLGLLAYVGIAEKGQKLYAPTWDPRISDDPESVFERAVVRVEERADTAVYWRTDGNRKASDPVHNLDHVTADAITDYFSRQRANGRGL